MEKLRFRVEFDDSDGLNMVRPHRQYFGRSKNALSVELEFGEDEPVFAFIANENEEMKGRSSKVEGGRGLVLTSDPDLYGTPDDRSAAGLMPLKKLKWGEWNLVGGY
jgi:hypothetical protein